MNHAIDDLDVAEVIFVLCSYDTRAATLYLTGKGNFIVFSGRRGQLTEGLFDKSEAEVFADIAMRKGVPADRISIEPEAGNTGHNVVLTHRLLLEQDKLPTDTVLLVQMPFMERRTYATFMKQWPGAENLNQVMVTAPQLPWEDYTDTTDPENSISTSELAIHVMVGITLRMRDYVANGFQIVKFLYPLPHPLMFIWLTLQLYSPWMCLKTRGKPHKD